MTLVRRGLAAAASGALACGSLCAQETTAIEHGKTVFERYCAPCHGDGRGADGAPTLPGTQALHLKYRDQKPALLERRTDLPAELIKAILRSGVASMPPFRKTEVTDEDIAAIAAYLAASARALPR